MYILMNIDIKHLIKKFNFLKPWSSNYIHEHEWHERFLQQKDCCNQDIDNINIIDKNEYIDNIEFNEKINDIIHVERYIESRIEW